MICTFTPFFTWYPRYVILDKKTIESQKNRTFIPHIPTYFMQMWENKFLSANRCECWELSPLLYEEKFILNLVESKKYWDCNYIFLIDWTKTEFIFVRNLSEKSNYNPN